MIDLFRWAMGFCWISDLQRAIIGNHLSLVSSLLVSMGQAGNVDHDPPQLSLSNLHHLVDQSYVRLHDYLLIATPARAIFVGRSSLEVWV